MNQFFMMKKTMLDKHMSFQIDNRSEYQNSLFIVDKMGSINKWKDCHNDLSDDK